MAMAVNHDASPAHLRRLPVGGALREDLAQHHGLLAEADRARIVREEVDEFVAKDAGATGLKHDDRNTGIDLRLKLIEDAEQVAASLIQEAEIVERPAAADMCLRNLHISSCRTEQLRR